MQLKIIQTWGSLNDKMTTAGNIIKLVPTIQAAALLNDNMKSMNTKKKKNTKDMMKMGVKNIVGVSMIKVTADLAGGFD